MTKDTENIENFSLAQFFDRGWDTFDAKFESFAPFARSLVHDGVVMREVSSAAQRSVRVHNPVTNVTSDVLMFGSNNYLGLANEPSVMEKAIAAIRRYGVGCGGPPLLNGMTSLHRELEARLASMKNCEDAMLFSSGYAANIGWVTGLLSPGDVLVYDAQSHASLYDGIKMGRTRSIAFAHNDMADLRRTLMQLRWQKAHANIAVCIEGVYSMDGDIAPLPQIKKLCSKYGALLAVDEAHATGVIGTRGAGTADHFGMKGSIDLVMGTFSKVFSATGAFVAGSRAMIDYLRFFARSYMFSASLPPPVIASVLAGLDFLDEHPERVTQLHENVKHLTVGLRNAGFSTDVTTAIIPILVPPHVRVPAVVSRLHEEGLFVNGIEYPAVPKDRQRLRLSVMATMTRADLDFAVDKLAKVAREFGFLHASSSPPIPPLETENKTP
jgi:8-amino-7-oxononanoate synthase